MPNVYIPNQSNHDFSDAERFGKLVFLTKGSLSRFAVAEMGRIAFEALKHSSPEDYILASSLTIFNMVLTTEMLARHGKVNVLIKGSHGYVLRTIVPVSERN